MSATDGVAWQQQVGSAGTVADGSSLTGTMKAPKNGYAYIYVSNASDQDVFFDNLKVGIIAGNIIEENHYYAYGLKIAPISSKKLGDSREGKLSNPYLYNGKELLDEDMDLGWYDYGFRDYDPQVGRFPQLDPLTDDYPELTPYQYASCDPVTNIDVDGLEGTSAIGAAAKAAEQWHQLENVTVIALRKIGATAPQIAKVRQIFEVAERVVNLITKLNTTSVGAGKAKVESTPTMMFGNPKTPGGKKEDSPKESKSEEKPDLEEGGEWAAGTAKFDIKRTYWAVKGSVSVAKAYIKKEHSTLYGDFGIGASAYNASLNGRLGTEKNNAFVDASGDLFSAQANLNYGLSFKQEEGKKRGLLGEATIGAYTAKGEVSGGISILGVKFSGTAGGSMLSAHAGIGGGAYYDPGSHNFVIKFEENIGLGLGEKFGFSIKIPIH